MSDVSKLLRSLTKNERCEQIAKGAHQKWASMRDMLRLLTKNERPWASHWGAHQKLANDWITYFLCAIQTKSKERISNSAYNEDFFISFLFLKVAHKTKFVLELVKKQS